MSPLTPLHLTLLQDLLQMAVGAYPEVCVCVCVCLLKGLFWDASLGLVLRTCNWLWKALKALAFVKIVCKFICFQTVLYSLLGCKPKLFDLDIVVGNVLVENCKKKQFKSNFALFFHRYICYNRHGNGFSANNYIINLSLYLLYIPVCVTFVGVGQDKSSSQSSSQLWLVHIFWSTTTSPSVTLPGKPRGSDTRTV